MLKVETLDVAELFKEIYVVCGTLKPGELVQLKLFEEPDCFKPFKFINSNKLRKKKI